MLTPMSRETSFLRTILLVDAFVTGSCGIAFAAGASALAAWFGLPEPLLRWSGVALIPFAGFLVWLARREAIPRGLALGIVSLNVLWAIDSVLLIALGWTAPTTIGIVFVLGQALIVAAFAELQYVGITRMTRG